MLSNMVAMCGYLNVSSLKLNTKKFSSSVALATFRYSVATCGECNCVGQHNVEYFIIIERSMGKQWLRYSKYDI